MLGEKAGGGGGREGGVCAEERRLVGAAKSFPSFETFFGEGTDVLYYSPQVKFLYAPFLSTCVKSLV